MDTSINTSKIAPPTIPEDSVPMCTSLAAQLIVARSVVQENRLYRVLPDTPLYHLSYSSSLTASESDAQAVKIVDSYFKYLQQKFHDFKERQRQRHNDGLPYSEREWQLVEGLNRAWDCETPEVADVYMWNSRFWYPSGCARFWDTLHELLVLEKGSPECSVVTDALTSQVRRALIQQNYTSIRDAARIVRASERLCGKSIGRGTQKHPNWHEVDAVFIQYVEEDGGSRLPSPIPFNYIDEC